MAIREFEEGTRGETNQDFEGKIVLARSDLERAIDRLNWSRPNEPEGLYPAAVVTSDKFRARSIGGRPSATESATHCSRNTRDPGPVKSSKAKRRSQGNAQYQELRLQRQVGRLATLQGKSKTAPSARTMVLSFTPTMPNVSYSSSPGFPFENDRNCSSCRTSTTWKSWPCCMSRSSIRLVPACAAVYVEGLGDRRIEGHVTRIALMPVLNLRSDVQPFEGIVRLENVPSGLRPGMSLGVRIALPRVENVLTVPRMRSGSKTATTIVSSLMKRAWSGVRSSWAR